MEAYFGSGPDEEAIRALIAAAADETTARAATFGMTEKRELRLYAIRWPASKPVRAGRFLVHRGATIVRCGSSRMTWRSRSRPGSPSAPGHHGTTRGCLMHFDRLLKRRRNFSRTGRVLDVGCGAGVLAIAAAKVLRRKVWLGDIDPVAVAVANANANARLNTALALLQGDRLARRRERRAARGRPA